MRCVGVEPISRQVAHGPPVVAPSDLARTLVRLLTPSTVPSGAEVWRTILIRAGKQIAAARALLQWTQADLAKAARLYRNAIAHWEAKAYIRDIYRESPGLAKIHKAFELAGVRFSTSLGVRLLCGVNNFARRSAHARARHGVKAFLNIQTAKKSNTHGPITSHGAQAAACGARTRAGGMCKAPPQKNGRCKLHGGRATGARTDAGRKKIAEVQRQRWAKWRELRRLQNSDQQQPTTDKKQDVAEGNDLSGQSQGGKISDSPSCNRHERKSDPTQAIDHSSAGNESGCGADPERPKLLIMRSQTLLTRLRGP